MASNAGRDEVRAFYTIEEAAQLLSVTPRTVKNMLRDGELASYRFRGCRRIAKADLDSYIERSREEVAVAA